MQKLFTNARFYTDIDRPPVSGVLMHNGCIAAVGYADELRQHTTRVREVDLGNATVFPAFTDSHIHLLAYGLRLGEVRLEECSLQETLARVQRQAQRCRPGDWLVGGGFNFNHWPEGWPRKEWLDRAAPSNPVVLTSKDAHMVWVNSCALDRCAITTAAAAPPGGSIIRDRSGEPIGILQENAMRLVLDRVPEPEPETCKQALKQAIESAHSHGITAAHIMEGTSTLAALQELLLRENLPFRAWCTLPQQQLDAACSIGLGAGFGNDRLRLGGVKIFADGSLGSRSAWMLAPYEDEHHCGTPVTPYDELLALTEQANSHGLPAVIHAIGDQANRVVLAALARAGNSALRNRIEHAQLLHPDDIKRFAQLQVIASVQPLHAPQDQAMAEKHWGQRSRYAYPFYSLLQAGATLCFGSDCPVEDCSVLRGLYAAVFRRHMERPTDPSWYPEECLSIKAALKAYTLGAAYAAGEENSRGTLTPGKKGDFVVLSDDILRQPERIPETTVLATYFEGEPVFQA